MKRGHECPDRTRTMVWLAIFSLWSHFAWAGQDPVHDLPIDRFVDATRLEDLANLVVTDTKLAQPLDSVTQKIVLMHAEAFERQPVANRNLAELMRYTSGQFVNVLSRNVGRLAAGRSRPAPARFSA